MTTVTFLILGQSLSAVLFTFYSTRVEGFPSDSDGKASACNAGDPVSIPGWGRSPGEWNGLPIPVFLPGKSHGQRSLAGYSPWGHKKSDMTEQLTLYLLNT